VPCPAVFSSPVGMATGPRGIPEESRAAMRAAARPGVSPTSTVWGDDCDAAAGLNMRQHMLSAAMGERHLAAMGERHLSA